MISEHVKNMTSWFQYILIQKASMISVLENDIVCS